jgi:type I restriction enzyme S subunit
MLASGGATRNALTKGMLETLRLVLPSMGAQTAFDSIAKPVIEKQSSNQNQNLLLSSLRDALLPKLISGEIHIPDAEKLLEKVGV